MFCKIMDDYNNGRLYQWDDGVQLSITDEDVKRQPYLWMGHRFSGEMIKVPVEYINGFPNRVTIPRELLQKPYDLKIYAMFHDGNNRQRVYAEQTIEVIPRPKPEGYDES